MTTQKPFLKWAGGKGKILDEFVPLIPNKFDNYHEIFLGGGSVLFAVLSLNKEKKIHIEGNIFAYDINEKLINVYNQIKFNHEELYENIKKYINVYLSINEYNGNQKPKNIDEAKSSKESYYFWLRKLFNETKTNSYENAALFIIINKLCFRGLYRESKNGFNVPFGNNKHIKSVDNIIIKDELDNISNLIQNVQFHCMNFNDSFKKIKNTDFVYLDPPYVPIKSDSFVSYNQDGFNYEKHCNLFNMIKKLQSKFILNNSYCKLVLDYFKDFKIKQISARRAINSKNPESKISEIIVYN